MRDRAASEVLGFVLVFSLIAASTGIVYGVGFTGLEDARDAERIENGERAFDVLADNIDDVVQQGAPSRATEVKLADARAGVGEETRIEVIAGSTAQVDTRPIVFQTNRKDASIVYEAGGVIRTDGDAGVFKRKPGFVIDEDRTVLALPQLEAPATGGVGGSTTVLVRTDRRGMSVLTDETPTSSITLRIETTEARAAAWNRYLETEIRNGFSAIGATDDPCTIIDPSPPAPPEARIVECAHSDFQPDRLLVTATRMGVQID